MPLPVLAVIAARLGIAVGRYLIKKGGKEVLKKGAATTLRNRIAAKAAKKATKRTSRPPTKAQIEATKARNKAKETISRRKADRMVAKGHHPMKSGKLWKEAHNRYMDKYRLSIKKHPRERTFHSEEKINR